MANRVLYLTILYLRNTTFQDSVRTRKKQTILWENTRNLIYEKEKKIMENEIMENGIVEGVEAVDEVATYNGPDG